MNKVWSYVISYFIPGLLFFMGFALFAQEGSVGESSEEKRMRPNYLNYEKQVLPIKRGEEVLKQEQEDRAIFFTQTEGAVVGNANVEASLGNTAPEFPVSELDAQGMVDLVLENSFELKEAREGVRHIARITATRFHTFLPQVSVGFSAGGSKDFGQGLSSFPGVVLDTDLQGAWAAFGQARLNVPFKLVSELALVKQQYLEGITNYEIALKETKRSALLLFYAFLNIQERLNYLEAQMKSALKVFQENERGFNNGRIAEIDYLSSQVQYENNRLKYERESNNYQKTKRDIFQRLGLRNVDVQLKGPWTEFDFLLREEDLLDLILKKPEYMLLLLQKKSLDLNVSSLITQLLPDLTLDVKYRYDRQIRTLARDQQNVDFGVTVGWNLTNLLPSSMLWADKKNKTNLKNIKEQEIMRRRYDFMLELQSFIQAVGIGQSSVKTSQLNVKNAEYAYQKTQVAYEAGRASLVVLQNAEDTLSQAYDQLLDIKYQFIQDVLALSSFLNIDVQDLRR